MGSHSVTCHLAEVIFPPLPQPIKAGTWFIDPGGMQGWVDLVGLATYRGGIPARRRSPIPVVNGINVEYCVHAIIDVTTALNHQHATVCHWLASKQRKQKRSLLPELSDVDSSSGKQSSELEVHSYLWIIVCINELCCDTYYICLIASHGRSLRLQILV